MQRYRQTAALFIRCINRYAPDHGAVGPASLTDDVVLVAIPRPCHVALRIRAIDNCHWLGGFDLRVLASECRGHA